jgi:streptogramin lyase
MTVDLGDHEYPDGYIWVGGYNTQKAWKLNPSNGRVIRDVDIGVPAYGMMTAANGDLYISTLGRGELQAVNTRTYEVGPVIGNPVGLRNGGSNSLGIAMDSSGRIWMNGWETPDAIAYDPSDGTWAKSKSHDKITTIKFLNKKQV